MEKEKKRMAVEKFFTLKTSRMNRKINFTIEEEVNKSMLFLDCIISRTNKNELKPSSYKKNTHTGQCSNFHSNEQLLVKLLTVKTLTKQAEVICSNKF